MFGLVLACCLIIQVSYSFNYCTITCNGTEHTLCKFEPGGGDDCKNNEKVYLSKDEKKMIVETLNFARNERAKNVSNMRKLIYDGNIGVIAKRWADQCVEPLHDKCRKYLDGVDVGQSSYIGYYTETDVTAEEKFSSRYERIKGILNTWLNESQYLLYEDIVSYNTSRDSIIGNFSQIMWAETFRIGCGYTEFSYPNKKLMFRFICDFYPKGALSSKSIYIEGKNCAKCPKDYTCSDSYSRLCWNGEANYFIENSSVTRKISIAAIMLLFVNTVISVGYVSQ